MKRYVLQINTRIDIIIDDVIYRTVIQDVVKDGFLISIPGNNGQYLTLKDSEFVILDNYADEQNLYRLSCNVIKKVDDDNLPLYKISMPTDIKKIQRRNYVRVNVLKPVQYCKLDVDDKVTALHNALMINLSGSGARLKIKEKLYYGDFIDVYIDIEELKLKVRGDIVRIEKSVDKRNIYGVRFQEQTIINTEAIIKSVFTIMRKQRELV